jgi:hypothetical protein
MPGNVAITTSSVPSNFCFQSFQNDWAFLVSLLSGNLANVGNFVNVGSVTPTPANENKPWIRDNPDGTPDKTYRHVSGVWVSEHPIPPGFSMLAPAGTIVADVPTLDGGLNEPLTAFTGPMWEVDTDMAAKFPIGPGTLGSGKVLNPGDTGGEEQHSLISSEMPPHTHGLDLVYREVGCNGSCFALKIDVAGAAGYQTDSTGGTGTPAVVAPHNTMPPYTVRIWIRRTLRRFYRL